MRLSILAAATAALAIAGCATAAKYSLEGDLKKIGFSPSVASCMADQLEDRLDSDDLVDLARHIDRLSEARDSGAALSALKRIDNPRVIAAATSSGLSCALAPN